MRGIGKKSMGSETAEFPRPYPLRYTRLGMIFMSPEDDCGAVVDAMLASGYTEEFCLALDWDLSFIARLMKAGFLVMSESFHDEGNGKQDIVLPKLHLVRSVLFFPRLHVKKSIRRFLDRYELRFDTDFEIIVRKCLDTHGDGWLTAALVRSLFALRKKSPKAAGQGSFPRPVSFGVYRDGELKAGEFGVICGRVYTSYSGYRDEDNAGTVQMILMVRWLENAGFDFLDFGMPLDYKTGLGAQNVTPEEFVSLWRKAQGR
ncbi:MAG: GNAT family N-acetyltransferase [Spirochaetaceae bacterium]|jgi:Leu/Phe-tRNA-protein transferase|nr:GNAT family N-acetyltransferase [Spirochaetaceae bacterium]